MKTNDYTRNWIIIYSQEHIPSTYTKPQAKCYWRKNSVMFFIAASAQWPLQLMVWSVGTEVAHREVFLPAAKLIDMHVFKSLDSKGVHWVRVTLELCVTQSFHDIFLTSSGEFEGVNKPWCYFSSDVVLLDQLCFRLQFHCPLNIICWSFCEQRKNKDWADLYIKNYGRDDVAIDWNLSLDWYFIWILWRL